MLLILILPVALSFASGQFCWRRIVLPSPATDNPEQWHIEFADAEARGDLACLIAKATFVLLWPFALGVGWLTGPRGLYP